MRIRSISQFSSPRPRCKAQSSEPTDRCALGHGDGGLPGTASGQTHGVTAWRVSVPTHAAYFTLRQYMQRKGHCSPDSFSHCFIFVEDPVKLTCRSLVPPTLTSGMLVTALQSMPMTQSEQRQETCNHTGVILLEARCSAATPPAGSGRLPESSRVLGRSCRWALEPPADSAQRRLASLRDRAARSSRTTLGAREVLRVGSTAAKLATCIVHK